MGLGLAVGVILKSLYVYLKSWIASSSIPHKDDGGGENINVLAYILMTKDRNLRFLSFVILVLVLSLGLFEN